MRRWFVGAARFVFVGVGIVLLTSFTIDATDALRGSQSALSILARNATEGACPSGTAPFMAEGRALCIDRYEVSAASGCPFATQSSVAHTVANLNTPDCAPQSVPDVEPWRFVASVQAEALCARAGKRLPTPAEWYAAALGTPGGDVSCNVNGALSLTGTYQGCRSGAGAFDMIGNVWELVSGSVVDRSFGDYELPESGYVSTLYDNGLPSHTTSTAQAIFDDAYFWSSDTGVMALMRGGFHGSRSDASIYTTHAKIDQTFSSAAIGFRCVLDL